jgi:hypothetical protein
MYLSSIQAVFASVKILFVELKNISLGDILYKTPSHFVPRCEKNEKNAFFFKNGVAKTKERGYIINTAAG